MQSFYAAQTEGKNSNVKYLNNVHIQTNNLQRTFIIEDEINTLTRNIRDMDSRVDTLEKNKTDIYEIETNMYNINVDIEKMKALINMYTVPDYVFNIPWIQTYVMDMYKNDIPLIRDTLIYHAIYIGKCQSDIKGLYSRVEGAVTTANTAYNTVYEFTENIYKEMDEFTNNIYNSMYNFTNEINNTVQELYVTVDMLNTIYVPKINKNETDIGNIKTDIGTINEEIGIINGRIGTIKSRVNDVESDIKGLYSMYDILDGRVDNLNTMYWVLDGRVDNLNTMYWKLDGKVKNLINDKSSFALEKEPAIMNSINELQTKEFNIMDSVAILQDSITEIENNNVNRLNTVDSQINSIRETQTATNNQIKELETKTEEMNTTINTTTENITKLTDSMNTQIGNLQKETDEKNTQTVDRLDKIDEDIKGLHKTDNSLETKINNLRVSTNEANNKCINRLDTIDTQVASIKEFTGMITPTSETNDLNSRLDIAEKQINEIIKQSTIICDEVASLDELMLYLDIYIYDSQNYNLKMFDEIYGHIYSMREENEQKIKEVYENTNKAIQEITNSFIIDNPLYGMYVGIIGDISSVYMGNSYSYDDKEQKAVLNTTVSYPDPKVKLTDMWWYKLLKDCRATIATNLSDVNMTFAKLNDNPDILNTLVYKDGEKSYKPNIIIIMLGAKDFETAMKDDTTQETFLSKYISVLQFIESIYPWTEVYVMAPVISTKDTTEHSKIQIFYALLKNGADYMFYNFIPTYLFARPRGDNIGYDSSKNIYYYTYAGMDKLTKGIERFILSN